MTKMDTKRIKRIVQHGIGKSYMTSPNRGGVTPSKLDILLENLLDSLIDGAISGMATGFLTNPDVGWKVAFANGFIKFLIRLKELRGKG